MKPLALFICETRPKQNLLNVINNHLEFTPESDLFIYHGRHNRYLKTIYPQAHLTEIQGEFNERSYNELLTSTSFWERFLDYEKVIIFQHDSAILRFGIEEFINMDVDYLGSPWLWPPYRGNGGLSLRSPKVMKEICEDMKWNPTLGNEDVAICNHMLRNNIGVLGSIEECESFACETIFKLGTWGYHAISEHLTPEECKSIKNQYNG